MIIFICKTSEKVITYSSSLKHYTIRTMNLKTFFNKAICIGNKHVMPILNVEYSNCALTHKSISK